MIDKFEAGKKYCIDNMDDIVYDVVAVTKNYVIFRDDMGAEDCDELRNLNLARWSEVKPKVIKSLTFGLYYDSWKDLSLWADDAKYLTKIGNIIIRTDINHDMKTEVEFEYVK